MAGEGCNFLFGRLAGFSQGFLFRIECIVVVAEFFDIKVFKAKEAGKRQNCSARRPSGSAGKNGKTGGEDCGEQGGGYRCVCQGDGSMSVNSVSEVCRDSYGDLR